MRLRLTRPTVGLSPTTPLIAAGQVIEPSVSVPIAASTSPAATAAPLPDEEPHGSRSRASGCWPTPKGLSCPELRRRQHASAQPAARRDGLRSQAKPYCRRWWEVARQTQCCL